VTISTPAGRLALSFCQFDLDCIDGFQGVLAGPHDNHAASDLTFTVQVSDTTPHFRPDLDTSHITRRTDTPASVVIKGILRKSSSDFR
jgi:hypothetical protein